MDTPPHQTIRDLFKARYWVKKDNNCTIVGVTGFDSSNNVVTFQGYHTSNSFIFQEFERKRDVFEFVEKYYPVMRLDE